MDIVTWMLAMTAGMVWLWLLRKSAAWWAAVVILGGGFATCVRSYRATRTARGDAPRAAALRPRRLAEASQPVGREAELQWQEALRAAALRDLGMVAVAISWLLGAAAALSFDYPSHMPGFVVPLTYVLFLVSTLLIAVSGMVAISKRGLRRVVA